MTVISMIDLLTSFVFLILVGSKSIDENFFFWRTNELHRLFDFS